MKRDFLKFGLLILIFFLLLQPVEAQRSANSSPYCVQTVVIDAGHGGKDPGAVSGGVKEKDIALKIALKTGAYISENYPDVKVLYTRKDDRFIELHRRAQIANEAQADLFISIHCNANKSSKPFGTETYVMGLHKSQANLEVAKKENAAILLEDNYEAQYEGYNPDLPENTIIFSLFQNAYLEQSLSIAELVEDQFRERVKRHDRGVKQAGFLVLYRTTMPGILVETGFLSNATERAFLSGEKGQTYIASAIFRAFKKYKEGQEKYNNLVQSASKEAIEMEEAEEVEKVYFCVQFLSSSSEKQLDALEFGGIADLKMYQHGGLYKYTSGEFSTFEQAAMHRKKIVAQGFKDSFVVAFYLGERIPINKAKALSADK